jgi:hypothetical protein
MTPKGSAEANLKVRIPLGSFGTSKIILNRPPNSNLRISSAREFASG